MSEPEGRSEEEMREIVHRTLICPEGLHSQACDVLAEDFRAAFEDLEAALATTRQEFEQSQRRVEELKLSMVEHFQRDHLAGDGPEIDRWKRRAQEAEAAAKVAWDNREAIVLRMHRAANADADDANAEAQALRERLEEAGKYAAVLLDLSCCEGLYWSWSPAEREAWEWLSSIAPAHPAPAEPWVLPKGFVRGADTFEDLPAPTAWPPERICADCKAVPADPGVTVCEECWDKAYKPQPTAPTAEPPEEIERCAHLSENEQLFRTRRCGDCGKPFTPVLADGKDYRCQDCAEKIASMLTGKPAPTAEPEPQRDAIEAARCAAGSGQHASCNPVPSEPPKHVCGCGSRHCDAPAEPEPDVQPEGRSTMPIGRAEPEPPQCPHGNPLKEDCPCAAPPEPSKGERSR